MLLRLLEFISPKNLRKENGRSLCIKVYTFNNNTIYYDVFSYSNSNNNNMFDGSTLDVCVHQHTPFHRGII